MVISSKPVYGCIPDAHDHRDHIYQASEALLQNLPRRIDLRPYCPPISHQRTLNSCTAQAIACAIQMEQVQQQLPYNFMPSRLFIYYNERAIQGTVEEDTGAAIRNALKTVTWQGYCVEDVWPYQIENFREKPPDACYQSALQHRAISYKRILHDLDHMKTCLASGRPFIFGTSIHESFESVEVALTGKVPLPKHGEKDFGRHALLAVGYDDDTETFLVRNSWGSFWGMAGYCSFPYDYMVSPTYIHDRWTLQRVE